MVQKYKKSIQLFLLTILCYLPIKAYEKEHVLGQTREIECLLELWAQKVVDSSIRKHIENLRESIVKLCAHEQACIEDFLLLNEALVEEIALCCTEKLEPCPINVNQFLKQVMNKASYTLEKDQNVLYEEVQYKVEKLHKVIAHLDYTPLATLANQVSMIGKKLYIDQIAQRAWPYALLGTYMMVAIPYEKMYGLLWPNEYELIKKEEIEEKLDSIKKNLEQCDSSWKKNIMALKEWFGGVWYQDKTSKKTSKYGPDGLINKKWMNWSNVFVSFDTETTLLKLSLLGTVIMPRITQDAQDLYNLLADCTTRVKHKVLGMPYQVLENEEVLLGDTCGYYISFICRQYCIPEENINQHYLMYELQGSTRKQIKEVFAYAAQRAHIQRRAITMNEIEDALDYLLRGITDQAFTEEEKMERAAYYAGELLMHQLLYPHTQCMRLTLLDTIDPVNKQKHKGFIFKAEPSVLKSKTDYLNASIYALAPAIAQELLFGQAPYEVLKATKQKAFGYVYTTVLQGDDPACLSESIKQKKLETTAALVEECYHRAYVYLLEHKEKLQNVFEVLKSHVSLNKEELVTLCC
ncbi:MAG: hypothetical protein WA432_01940 [Candidatus Babeliaceae bacterium]